jgi:hypothetical protein
MEYVTVTGVEIATVGMEWRASTGPFTCTFENLADAATAANDDPLIITPRLKLGHTSMINGEARIVDPFAELGDGAPAFGRVINLRLESAGAKLVGDFIEVPEWLGEALPSAYPGRSMECRQFVDTEGGKHYSAVISAVSLLGPIEPAIKDLADLERFLIEGPTAAEIAAATTPEEGRMSETIDASVATGTIRERFNWDWAMGNPIDDVDTYYWWCRDVRVDPNEVIADDTEGGTWSVPFETDGKDEVTFGTPVQVREEFVPIAASAEGVAAAVRQRVDQRVLASNLERPEKPAPKPAASAQPDNEEDTMDAKAIRDSLGLAEDATDEEVIAKGQELREAATEGETEETTETTEAAEVETPEPVAASVDPAALEDLKSDAAAGRVARTTQLKAERDGIIETALKAGKFPPVSAASYRDQLEKGGDIEASTRKFLDELAEGVVPVTEMGASHQADAGDLNRRLSALRLPTRA